MYSLDIFRIKCDVLLKDAINNGDKTSIDKYTEIKSILSSDDCFRNVDNLFIRNKVIFNHVFFSQY